MGELRNAYTVLWKPKTNEYKILLQMENIQT